VDFNVNKSDSRISSNLIEEKDKVEYGEIQIIEDTEMHKEVVKPKKQCCNATPYVLMIALSVHAAFEGLALGLQT